MNEHIQAALAITALRKAMEGMDPDRQIFIAQSISEEAQMVCAQAYHAHPDARPIFDDEHFRYLATPDFLR